MAKKMFRVTVPYTTYFIGEFEAEDEEDATKMFFEAPAEELEEEWYGVSDTEEIAVEEVEEEKQ